MARTSTREKPPAGAPDTPPDPRKRAVRVRAATLLGALKDVLGLVTAKDSIPILSHVLAVVGDGRIELTASDLDIWAVRDCASDDRDGPASKEWLDSIRSFAIALPAKPLAAVLGELDGDAMVTLTAPDDLTETYAGQAILQAGRARFKLHCLPSGEFPMPPPVLAEQCFEMPCTALADAFAAVEHAISTEETRYYLNGIYLHPAGLALRMASTDGSRLARLSIDAPDGAASFPPAIVGRRTIALLDKLLTAAAKAGESAGGAPPRVLVESVAGGRGSLMAFSMPAGDGGEVRVVAKTIDGDYPDYARVIPSDPPNRAVMARDPLAEAVKRVAVLAETKTRVVRAEFTTDKLTLLVASAEFGEASEELPCDYAGPDIALGFNAAYWRQALGAMSGDTVAMMFDDAQGPVRLQSPDDAGSGDGEPRLVQVLMPMRVA